MVKRFDRLGARATSHPMQPPACYDQHLVGLHASPHAVHRYIVIRLGAGLDGCIRVHGVWILKHRSRSVHNYACILLVLNYACILLLLICAHRYTTTRVSY